MATPPDTFSLDSIRTLLQAHPDLMSPRQSLFLSSGYRDAVKAEFSVAESNPLYQSAMSYVGIPVRTFDIPKQKVYDWSGCRSPSRAKRRHARGIQQRVKITERDVAYLIDERALSSWWTGTLEGDVGFPVPSGK